MKNRIITISREFGSGGRTIGKLVADQLGIPCYDSELIEKISEQSGFDQEYLKRNGEQGSGNYISFFSNRIFGMTNEDYIWSIQCNVIKKLAEESSCVIIGRCADYVLKNHENCLKVFIHADFEFRKKRIVEVYGEKDLSPELRIKDKDKRRISYRRFYTNMKWGRAKNYDICLNSGNLGINKCVDIIKALY